MGFGTTDAQDTQTPREVPSLTVYPLLKRIKDHKEPIILFRPLRSFSVLRE